MIRHYALLQDQLIRRTIHIPSLHLSRAKLRDRTAPQVLFKRIRAACAILLR